MRIAQVSTVGTPVRRDGSDSIEHLVWLLTEELVRLGHEVTVFAAAGSETAGRLEATLPGPYGVGGAPGDWHVCEWFNLCHAVREAGRFDVLHCHGYLWGLPLEGLSAAPMVHTLHVMPYESQARMWSLAPRAVVTAISSYQWSAFPQLRPHAVVHHGIDPRQYDLELQPEDYVCYLGRFIPAKGPLEAIAVARELGIRILLAGPRSEYFDRHVAPLVDGRNVDYVGYVGGPAKTRLLGGARALLYPVQAPEPFGLVLIEAMMCGTPVVALELGAVAEVVSFAETGYYGRTPGDLAALLPRAFALDRSAIRRRAETAFSASRMAADYARIFAEVAGTARPAEAAGRL